MKNHEHLVVRYSPLDGGLVNCGPVLNWLPLDNRGNRLIRREYTLSNLNSLFHVIHFLLLELLEKQLKECMTLLSTTSTISGLCRGFWWRIDVCPSIRWLFRHYTPSLVYFFNVIVTDVILLLYFLVNHGRRRASYSEGWIGHQYPCSCSSICHQSISGSGWHWDFSRREYTTRLHKTYYHYHASSWLSCWGFCAFGLQTLSFVSCNCIHLRHPPHDAVTCLSMHVR